MSVKTLALYKTALLSRLHLLVCSYACAGAAEFEIQAAGAPAAAACPLHDQGGGAVGGEGVGEGMERCGSG